METLSQLRLLRESLPPASAENVELRQQLLEEAKQLALALEEPHNVVGRVCFQLIETSAIRTATKMNLFEPLNQSEASTCEELADACGIDPVLTSRILQCLASHGAVKQIGPNLYGPTTVSRTFADRRSEAGLEFCHDILAPGWIAMPKFLAQRNWQNPSSRVDTAIAQGWNKPGGSFIEIVKDSPSLDAFNLFMTGYNDGHQDWLDIYPATERLLKGAETGPASVMMVDVGGGQGHQAVRARAKFPDWPGRYIVQDLPQGLPDEQAPGIEYMVHDFTQEQPIKGARFYYMRWIIHDWSQEHNTLICSQLRKAMKPGYSRLIINEWIVPDQGASRLMTNMDLNLMCSSGGVERPLALHKEYLEKAGLKISAVYGVDDGISESVIEAEVA